VNGPGSVAASISNTCGQSFDTIEVGLLPAIPTLDLGADQSLCPGELIVINPNILNVEYLWQDGSTNSSYQTTQAEIVYLSISNDCGTSTDTVEIIESTQGPQVDLGPDVQVCEGETVTILSGISGVDYAWQDGSTNPDFTTTQSGTFILHVSNNCGSDVDTILVDISGVPPTPALGQDTTLCEGMIIVLQSNADAETTIEWQNGSGNPSFSVSVAGTYILSESNRCGDAADTIVVAYLDAPDPFSFGPDTTLCPGESITLTAPSLDYEIMWQDGSQQPSIVANTANTYSLQLSNDCGTVSDAIQVDFDNRTPQLNLATPIPWCEGDIISLDATQPFIAEYLWSTGAVSPSIQVNAVGQYIIDVTTLCSEVSQQVDVVPGTDCVVPVFHKGIYVPNVFSPNGDGVNDIFKIELGSDLQIISSVGTIYDRWGNLVYQAGTIEFTWDGYYADEPVMPGVYVYTVNLRYMDQDREREDVFIGDVTVVK
jgi:gliding motility-associated-like protein